MVSSTDAVPAWLRGLVEDSSTEAPRSLSLEAAVGSHLGHRDAWYADLTGSLVVTDAQLPRLAAVAPGPLGLIVVVSGGAGALEPAVRWSSREAVELQGLHVAMRESDAGDLAPNARRICTALDALLASGDLDEHVAVYVEAPARRGHPSASWLGALDEVAAAGHRFALRTGGPGGVPGSEEIARCIGAALDRELEFTCVGGAGRAVRDRGSDQHGFLNIAVATRASLDGASPADVATLLDEVDADVLTGSVDAAGLAGAHRWFASVSCPDVGTTVTDLLDLGLLTDPAAL